MLEFAIVTVLLFILMLAAMEAGHQRRIRLNDKVLKVEDSRKVIDNFVLTLLSLILAFSLYSTRDQFKARDTTLVEEAEAVRSTSYHADSLSPAFRGEEEALLRTYVSQRREYGAILETTGDPVPIYKESRATLAEMREALHGEHDELAAQMFLGAVDDMATIAARRHTLVLNPQINEVLVLLVAIALLAGFLVGRGLSGERHEQRGHRWIFAIVVAITLAVIYDYDTPRSGFIRVDREDYLFDEALPVNSAKVPVTQEG